MGLPSSRLVIATTASLVLSVFAAAQAPSRPQPYVVRDVRLVDEEDAPRVNLLLRGGRIQAIVDAAEEAPPGARVVDGKGYLATPALIDAFSYGGCETPEPVAQQDMPISTDSDVRVDMREANRKGIQPAFRASDVLGFPDDGAKGWREAGFGSLLSSPHGELLAGDRRVLCEANTARDIERWIRLADEVGLKVAIAGGRRVAVVSPVALDTQHVPPGPGLVDDGQIERVPGAADPHGQPHTAFGKGVVDSLGQR